MRDLGASPAALRGMMQATLSFDVQVPGRWVDA